MSYLHGDVTDTALYDALAQHIGSKRCLYYLEMPPSLFAPIVENLGKAGLLQESRVAVEKPFGHDLKSAGELNARLRALLDEDQIFRVDHFLGKEPVVELEYLRFGNLALVELWDRHSISEIQITMAEDFGVDDRGGSMTGLAPCATSCKTICCRCSPEWRWSPRWGRARTTSTTKKPTCCARYRRWTRTMRAGSISRLHRH